MAEVIELRPPATDDDALRWLRAKWPAAFCNPPRPLRGGIHRDAYLAATVAGAPRIDLAGNAVDSVSTDEAAWAAAQRNRSS